ncbi:guanylate kinase [Wenzhouxiangella marina]|uniref:Guanylate kinase n=1 Tax=Wenzhouxiangella marina TaxID=1579979 RepID=A0A0K0XSI2_9GAMM|nr:guanylate kinase [Wenzhouxiangella marina]AKS40643.1 guanylate kinase [Wenzhouxiangella marina]MBB6088412.1 guanylate kinase [Wenzhouxiangella marina]
MSSKGELYVIAAPSGAGKTSLMRGLLKRCPRLSLSVSDTTRPARAGEVDGEQYHFVSVEEFKAGIEAGDYLEYAEVYGNFYGTRRDRVEALWAAGRDVLLEIDVQGARSVRAQFPGLCSMFILPPSMKILAERLKGRGSDAPEVIERRLGEARAELEACGDFRWMVVNDDFDTALEELTSIVKVWPLRRARQAKRVTRLLDEIPARDTMKD